MHLKLDIKSLKTNRKKYEKHSKFKRTQMFSLLTNDNNQRLLQFNKKTHCRCQEMAFTNTDLRATIRWTSHNLKYKNNERLNKLIKPNILNNNNNNNNNNLIKIKPANNTNHDRRRAPSKFNVINLILTKHQSFLPFLFVLQYISYLWIYASVIMSTAAASDLEKSDRFLDKINEQSIAAVFNKVAYGSTTKRSIPDNAYIYTTLATPLLTTYKYSDGNQEWYRVDVKEPEIITDNLDETGNRNSETDSKDTDNEDDDDDDDPAPAPPGNHRDRTPDRDSYGIDLEKDHVLPTSAPAADILKNNNNKNYNNPNRYNNDKLRPEQPIPPLPDRLNPGFVESVTEKELPRTSTGYSVLRNVRPTKSMFGKDIPSYVPPSRSFFTPPLPPEYLNPFADKPTLRGTNSDTYQNRRPIPPPSLMPKKDRIPFRPDLPPSVSDSNQRSSPENNNNNHHHHQQQQQQQHHYYPNNDKTITITTNYTPNSQQPNNNNSNDFRERKKTLNTPSQNVHLDRLGEFYGLNRNLHNESNFEYEPMVLIPSISRILSGSNGRKEDLPDILLRTVTAAPRNNMPQQQENNRQKMRHDDSTQPEQRKKHFNVGDDSDNKQHHIGVVDNHPRNNDDTDDDVSLNNDNLNQQASVASPSVPKNESPNQNRNRETDLIDAADGKPSSMDTTTIISDILNLPNVKVKSKPEVLNTTRAAAGHEIWSISWNVHIYLVVFLYVILAIFSIVKLVRYERENHMFSKSYFLAVHLLLTTICVLRIFYLAYDPYNINMSFGIFTYDILHNLPLSLLATTFAILIVFLLKRTLTHLKVKTRPVFLVLFSLGHMFLCFCLNLAESFDLFTRQSFWSLICRFVYILLCWSLGLSYVYLYKIIKNVLAKKSQNLSEMCSQNISYASHITIAIALLFTLLGFVELYGLFFIKIDRFIIAQHWILWGWELSIRLLEISIITLLAIVVSLRMSQREKTNVGFPLFPCTTSDSSSDNIYPNNCSTNLNALNYSLRSTQTQYRTQNNHPNIAAAAAAQQTLNNDDALTDVVERPNHLLADKKSTLERNFPQIQMGKQSNASDASDNERSSNFERFERPNWQGSSQRFGGHHQHHLHHNHHHLEANFERDNFPIRNFERTGNNNNHDGGGGGDDDEQQQFDARGGSGRFTDAHGSSNHSGGSGSTRSSLKPYEKCRYYAKPKYDDYNNSSSCSGGGGGGGGGTGADDEQPKLLKRDGAADDSSNLYSEPLDVSAGTSTNTDRSSEYERRYQELDRQDVERRSRSSWTNSGSRRSTGRNRKSDRERSGRNHQAGVHTLPNQDSNASMLVDERGFLRFRQLGEEDMAASTKSRKHRYHQNDLNHYSDA